MSAADFGLAGDAAAVPGVSNASYSGAVGAALMPSSTTSLPSASVAPSALREDQVSNAVSFLVHPKVRDTSREREKRVSMC